MTSTGVGLLDGRAGVITGAAGGMGRASAIACAREGGAVAVTDLIAREADGRETVRLIEEEGGRAFWHPLDVSNAAEQEAAVAAVVAAYGRLDFAHNNAGIVNGGPIIDIDEGDFDAQHRVNVKGVLLGMKYQLRQMLAQDDSQQASIVNTASLAGIVAVPGASAYVASKHGVIGLTKTAAMEVADRGIRVNCVCPAAVRTPMMEAQSPEHIASLIAPQAFKRLADPSEVAHVVTFLLSDRASFITGLAMPVDGGALAT
jgi:NAD(P)-dependent dehydrogenase (short-subunit alcohol dehydrogenase family)